MVKIVPSPSLWKRLAEVDTPTVCNAIEVAQGKRGFNNYTKGTFHTSNSKEPPIVGYARTAKIIGLKKSTRLPEEIKKIRMDYFRHMSHGNLPKAAVVEDEDYPNCVSAWWGEVHTAVHKGLGVKGAITNGVMRDLDDLEPGFPVLSGSIGPSHAFVRATKIGGKVTIFNLEIENGDLLHADQHGAVVIPNDVILGLEMAIDKLVSTERLILKAAREPNFNYEKLEKAWTEFEKART
jgi:regulator of RNase E activity RraA